MFSIPSQDEGIVRRVRAILLTPRGTLMFIKRVKPDRPPYWVAPGGGVESGDASLRDTLNRELSEELGATVEVLETAFVLHHQKAGKNLEEHFYICRLRTFDLSLRHGPEFNKPERGLFLVEELPLTPEAISAIYIKTEELRDWLLANLDHLQQLASQKQPTKTLERLPYVPCIRLANLS